MNVKILKNNDYNILLWSSDFSSMILTLTGVDETSLRSPILKQSWHDIKRVGKKLFASRITADQIKENLIDGPITSEIGSTFISPLTTSGESTHSGFIIILIKV